MVLDNIEPRRVMHWFEALCAIPHGSGNTKKISDFCVEFARERSFEHYQDSLNNVIIIAPPSPGYEASPTVIIQGHLDMVCEKTADCGIDFKTDGLSLETDGKYVWASGTTLGGDDGIAIAMALAIMEDTALPHPRLEAVFTVDEETGMYGAAGIDCSRLQGRTMLNLDSEDEGIFTVGCAGGVRANCALPVETEPFSGRAVHIAVSGLTGGHSGQEIDKCRASANMLMGRVLAALMPDGGFRLVSITGGNMDNAICVQADAVAAVGDVEAARRAVAELEKALKREYETPDPGLCVTLEETAAAELCMTRRSTQSCVSALLMFPSGVQEMCPDIPGLVETSLNLGILRAGPDGFTASFSVRSSVGSRKELLKLKLETVMRALGGSVSFAGQYPAWEFRRDSHLRDTMTEVFREQYGREPQVLTIHAGLECGLLGEKLPGLDCVSIGPDLHDIHTPRERMDIASVQRVWRFVLEVLKRLKV